ncbi:MULTISPECIES: hypothetical protein [Burkholderia]|jgi:hypothetical protein|uniref:hypothetical protein n=1 Tax=Burkholderia TaxID=32008 RepID=UPI0005AF1E9D|nr:MULTISPECIES: hypothetical protein [Burkholderia]ALK30449.1 hypothetical protein bpln_1g16420 [Burkholderia plantarii]MBI0328787.1 hypothetical protein [Burkholderia plantarii]WLE59140.1 hypothetical protein GIY62_18980 [Burkholderia plantarii]GLZ18563.1 hypothetical protein Bpla01_20930 [Burkholderia plantarii]
MFPVLSPDAIDALKWLDRFGGLRPMPSQFAPLIDGLLNDGYVYQSGAGLVDLTDDGRAYLSEQFD